MSLGERLKQYAYLTRLDRPIGIFLLMWPTLWALWLSSEGRPDPWVFTVFVLGVFLMRSAGCVINDYADKDIDPHVARTQNRPLASRAVGTTEALVLCCVLSLVAFGLVLTLNTKTIGLAVIGAFLAATYPLMKRFTHFPQVYLGAAFTWGVPMAYTAHTNHVPPIAWWLFGTGVLWVVVYDTFYAMVDRDDDIKVGIKSTAVLFGSWDRLVTGVLQVLVLIFLAMLGDWANLGLWYFLGVAAAALFALYQQFLIRNRERDPCFRAFLNNNWFGLMVFLGIVLHYTFQFPVA